MQGFRFINEMDDRERKRDYANLLFRIAEVLKENDSDGWRTSYPFKPSYHSRPWVPAKPGHLNKLEDEGVISREKKSNSTSIYYLEMDKAEISERLERYHDLIDQEHPTSDLEMGD